MKDFVLEFERDTDVQKVRYSRKVDDEVFRIYNFISRMPVDWPKKISLTLGRPGNVPEERIYTLEELQNNPSLRNEPIYDELHKMPGPEPIHSVVFQPYERNERPTFGETYIPRNVLADTFAEGDEVEEVAILVKW